MLSSLIEIMLAMLEMTKLVQWLKVKKAGQRRRIKQDKADGAADDAIEVVRRTAKIDPG